jgi:hypothetical protein
MDSVKINNFNSEFNESFKLLQLTDSESSKTLSDLELLPEIVQRKRKVRRSTCNYLSLYNFIQK